MNIKQLYYFFIFVFITFFPYTIIPFKIKIFIFEFVLLLMTFLFLLLRTDVFLKLRKFEIFYLLYFLFQIIFIWRYQFVLRELFGLHIILYSYLFMIIFSNLQFDKKVLIKYLTLSYMFFAIVVLFLIVTYNGGTHKIITFLGKSNYLASILLIPVGYIGVFLFNGIKNYLYIFTFIISSVDIVLLKSRTATLVLALYLFMGLFLKLSKIYRVLLIVFFAAIFYFIRENIFLLLTDVENDYNVLLRVIIWQDYIHVFLEHIYIGIGLQQVLTNITTFGSHLVGFTQAHNFILQIFAESGIVGFSLFFLFLYTLFRFIIKKKNDIYTFPLIGVLIVVLLHGLAEPNLTGKLFSIYFFMTIGIFTNKQTILKKDDYAKI